MKKYFIAIFTCLCMFFSCRQKKTVEAESKESAVYTIDIDSIKTVDALKMSSIFTKARAIILEETDYSLIGMINKLQVYENYVFVLDISVAKKLFIFDRKSGKYIRQIGSFGQGPGEYLFMVDFCLDIANREAYIYDAGKQMLHKYNFDNGKHIKSINMRYNEKFFHYIMYLNNKIYANVLNHDNLLVEFDIKTNNYKEFLNADEYNCGWNDASFRAPNSFFISDLDSPKFVEIFMSTVISIDETGLRPYLTVKSKDWVKKSDLPPDIDSDISGVLFDDLPNKGRVCNIQNYMEYGDYIYFDYEGGFSCYFVVFNKKTNEAYQCNKIKLNQDLVLTGANGYYSYMPFPFISNKNAYSLWHIFDSDSELEEIQGALDSELKEHQVALDLENREALLNALQKKEEFNMIIEYEFK